VAAYSRRLSASIESAASFGGYDRSPKIVEMDTGRPRSRASSLRTDDDWYAQSVSSPLLPYCHLPGGAPPRIAVPSSRHFPEYEWCALEKPRPATAQCTPGVSLPSSRRRPPANSVRDSQEGAGHGILLAEEVVSANQSMKPFLRLPMVNQRW